MTQLIPLHSQTIDGNAVETVSARELHTFLGVQTRFNDWIATRISEYDFMENQDYVRFTENPVKPQGGRPSMGYFITLRMAKELSMVERNEKGKQARKYFIECEEQLKEAATQKPVPLTFAEALRAYADEVEAHEQTKQTLTIAEPKAQYFDKLVERNLLTNFTTTAKEFGIKRKDFINYLLDNGYIYRDQQGNLLPYATHVPHLFEVKEYSKDAHSGVQTLVTPKGRETLRLLLT